MVRTTETDLSKEIRILSEVEKIWIIFDGDNNGTLDREEIKGYIKFMAEPVLQLCDQQIDEIFNLIDDDINGSIDKQEMTMFLKVMMLFQEDLAFKKSHLYIEYLDKMKQEKRKKKNKTDNEKLAKIMQEKLKNKFQKVLNLKM